MTLARGGQGRRGPAWCALWLAAGCGAEPAAPAHVEVVAAGLRPDSPDTTELPPYYGPDDEVESFPSPGGAFRVHFTRRGPHLVSAVDEDGDGVPDFVQRVAEEYDTVLSFYSEELGLSPPLSDESVPDGNGGDARFDVYLLDFPGSADGSFRQELCLPDAPHRCAGYMVQENDFLGRPYPSVDTGVRTLASHEFFHAVQAGYHSAMGSVLGEGTAVWASEAYDPDLPDLEGFVDSYLARPDRSLAQGPTGPVDAYSYGSALFFRFLEERFDRDVLRLLFEALRAAGTDADADGDGFADWPPLLDEVLQAGHDASLGEAFVEFCRWNLQTADRAAPDQAYREGAAYPRVTEQSVELPFADELVRVFPLSARYYAAAVAERAAIAIEARLDPAATNLALVLALESDSRITTFEVVRPAAAATELAATVDAGPGDVVHLALIGTHLTGESVRPAVCFAPEVELADCWAQLLGEDEAQDPDGGEAVADAGVDPSAGDADGGGCAVGGGAVPSGVWLAVFGLWTRRRLRTRALDLRGWDHGCY